MINALCTTPRGPAARSTSPAFVWCLLPLAMLAGCGGGTGDIQGTITGLDASGLALSDGTTTLSIASGSTSFSFSTTLDENASYAVTVTSQPTGLSCSVTNGSGTASADSTISVAIACTPIYSVSGTIGGLTGSGLVLSDGTESITVDPNAASFAFPTPLAQDADYQIEVVTQPGGQTCNVANIDGTPASGTVDGAAVTNVEVTCG